MIYFRVSIGEFNVCWNLVRDDLIYSGFRVFRGGLRVFGMVLLVFLVKYSFFEFGFFNYLEKSFRRGWKKFCLEIENLFFVFWFG